MLGVLRNRLRRIRAEINTPPPGAPPAQLSQGDGASAYPAPMAPPTSFGPPPPTLGTGPNGSLDPGPGEMPFLDHLEELRWHIIKALAGLVITTAACLFFAQWIVDSLLLAPTRVGFISYQILGITPVEVTLQNRTLTGQFFAYFGTVLATGILLGSPFVVWQFWRFIEPGLYKHERNHLRFAAFYATFFFLLGVAFGYLVLTPMALQFFAQFTVSSQILNEFDITKYFEMVLMWSFGTGFLFELPVVVFVLSRLGVVTQAMLRKGRKYALIIILVVAAVLTPPDPLSQIILAVPLLLLYEISIVQAGFVERARTRDEARRIAEEAAARAARVAAGLPPEEPED